MESSALTVAAGVEDDHPGRRRRLAGLRPLEILLLAGLAVAVAYVPYLPTHDGPQHIFTVHAANHLDAPETGWSDWFDPHRPVSNYGFSAVFTPLDLWLPWMTATRASLALMVVLWASGALCLARAVHPGREALGLALAAAALQWPLYMGFFSFYVSSACGLYVLAFAVSTGRGARAGRARRELLLGVLLLAQALLHLVPAIFTGLCVLALSLTRSAPGGRLRAATRAALVGAPAAGVALLALLVQQSAAAPAPPDPELAWHYSPAPVWTLAKCFAGGPAWRAWPLTALALAALPLALATRRSLGPRSAEDGALLASGAALVVAAVALPLHLPNWDFFSVRCVPLGVCALVLTLPVERLPRPGRRAVVAASTAFACAATIWAFAYHRDLYARSADALAGLEAGVSRRGTLLPIVLDPTLGQPLAGADLPMPFVAPLLNLGKLYAAAQGGIVPYTFASDPSIHPVLLSEQGRRRLPRAADPRYVIDFLAPEHAGDLALREAVTAYLAAHGTRYEQVLLWGRPEDVDHLEWLGFAPDWRRGGLVLAHFRGCPLEVRFPAGSTPRQGDVLELGWYPALGETHRYSLKKARQQPDGSFVLPLRQSCGALWLRFADTGEVCAGADAAGRLVLLPGRRHEEVECRVERRDIATAASGPADLPAPSPKAKPTRAQTPLPL